MEEWPWGWLMYHALDLGVSVREFWEMSPRAVWCLQQQLTDQLKRRREAQEQKPEPKRLSYIPH